jgi:chemotaxis protein histidine kinase CheA
MSNDTMNNAAGLHEVDSKIHTELKRYMPYSLSEYRNNDPEHPNNRERFEVFYQAVMRNIEPLNSRIEEVRRTDKDIPRDKRISKITERLFKALAEFWEKLDPTMKDYEKSFAEAEQAVENAKKQPQAASLADELKGTMRASEIRAHVEKSGPNALKLVLDAAQAGRLDILQAVAEAPFPLIPEDTMQNAFEMYLKAYHKNLLAEKEKAEFFREALALKVFALNRGIDQLSKSNFQ